MPITCVAALLLALTLPLAAAPSGFKQPDPARHPNLFTWTDTCNVHVIRDGDAALLIDLGDALADGRQFRDLAELKKLLLAEPDALARGLAEKLLIYATGHGLEFTDEAVLTDLVRQAKAKNYGFRSLVHAVVASPTFQTK